MKNVYIISFLVLITLSNNLFCQSDAVSKVGTTAAAFLEIPVGAPAVGIGGAFVSIANDASALYWNVGSISTLGKFDVQLTHMEWIGETKFNFVGLVLPLAEFGTLGFSFTSLSMDDMLVRTVEQPEGTGEYFSAGNIAIGLSYARSLTERFSIGITAKYISEEIWHMQSQGWAIDAGTIFKTDILGGMIIGAAISNFGTSMALSGRDTRYFIRIDETKTGSSESVPTNIEMDSWELPLNFRIGVSTNAVNTDKYRFTMAVDAIHPNNDYPSMNVGAEFSFMEIFMLRGGYNALFLTDGEGGLSLGVGLSSQMLFSEAVVQFDYAYRDFGRLQNVHQFSLEFKF